MYSRSSAVSTVEAPDHLHQVSPRFIPKILDVKIVRERMQFRLGIVCSLLVGELQRTQPMKGSTAANRVTSVPVERGKSGERLHVLEFI